MSTATNYRKIKLTRKVATVLYGPPGSGKTRTAESLASKGTWGIVNGSNLRDKFGLSETLISEPETLVIEGLQFTPKNMAVVKTLLTSKNIEVFRKHKPSLVVNTPKHIIICTTHEESLNLCREDRRFAIVNLSLNHSH